MSQKSKIRRRCLITSSVKGVEKAKQILVRQGISSLSAFAKNNFLAKTSVDKFFNHHPMQLDTFQRICDALKVKDWKDFAQLENIIDQIETANPSEKMHESLEDNNTNQITIVKSKVTITGCDGKLKVEIVLEGSIDVVNLRIQSLLEGRMRDSAGDTIRIVDIHAGSIKVTVEGSIRHITKLLDQINSTDLTDIEGFWIQDCRILSEHFLANLGQFSNSEKWQLVRDIVQNPQIGRQLSGADLSDADLSDTILSDADLRGANLEGADLSRADLSSINSLRLDLRDFHKRLTLLSKTDRRALFNRLPLIKQRALLALFNLLDRIDQQTYDLASASFDSCAKLHGANFMSAIVEGCNFGNGTGLEPYEKEDLKRRGAIFNDPLEDPMLVAPYLFPI